MRKLLGCLFVLVFVLSLPANADDLKVVNEHFANDFRRNKNVKDSYTYKTDRHKRINQAEAE